jgi:hypothetical protein
VCQHSSGEDHLPPQRSANQKPPVTPASPPLFEVVIVSWGLMERVRSVTSESRLNYNWTATPSAAGRTLPYHRSVTSRLMELYTECVDNGGWARVLLEARGGKETSLRCFYPSPSPT